ncbi:MAG: DUF438 domain-containing protein [Candidatus Omnitrophica bacterium]|nr:DUF438 domain-containing protein [Candidatus Omnitrophota bacterium]
MEKNKLQRKEKIKEVIKKLDQAKGGQLKQVKKEAIQFFKDIEPDELALAEQELIKEGTERSQIKKLCDVHLEVMKEKLEGIEQKDLPAWHPIQISKDEHKVIKEKLKKLKVTLDVISKKSSREEAKAEIDELKNLGHFFLETEKHHRREEEAIFPYLEKHGIHEPPQIFTEDHHEFLAKKKELDRLSKEADNLEFKQFVKNIKEIGEFLIENLASHIYKEDNILYPMSLKYLSDQEWHEVRDKFDQIGYCCFSPKV